MGIPLQEEKLSLEDTDGKTVPQDQGAFHFLVPPEWVSVLVFMVSVITGSNEDRTVQCWSPLPSLAVALETTGHAPHHLQHSGERALHLAWTAQ